MCREKVADYYDLSAIRENFFMVVKPFTIIFV